ncbi:MFS transporter [Calidithermus timidus]|jgi:MFS family permease|uniref:MFS transporter n=1 Tax=Calidithermus timidus TaxID=307124 RepID=UPI000378C0C6|nr:MFS transporter [Calidithermus timidus]
MSETQQLAMRFVIGIGLVSLFADFTYEGGRSIGGPFLAVLGAGPLLVGAVAGVGEFLGYLVRLFAGRLADRTGRHWALMYAGYALNLLSVPALALTGAAWSASALIFLERLGKGLRTPARDALLSRAGKEVGHGRVFGLHELLDQLGAFLGPLAVAWLVAQGGYRLGFAGLLLPALLALLFLVRARGLKQAEVPPQRGSWEGFPRAYYAYLTFAALSVAGFAHFQLIAYHLEVTQRVPPATIPLLFALAMGADALVAYGVGHLYDRWGLRMLLALPLLSLPSVPLFFLGQGLEVLGLAAILWGGAMGLQESLMRSAVATLTPEAQRGTAYGLFDTAYGAAWMLGSLAMGFFYGVALGYLVGFAVLLQMASVIFGLRFYTALRGG